ncbi:MAG: hypothetical protein WCS43_02350 [Verrucomicrobiota bacterium]
MIFTPTKILPFLTAPILASGTLAAASLADSRPANAVQSNVEEIIIVIKTHFDIGYTHRVKDIIQLYRTGMIDHAMNIMDQSKKLPTEQQFAWTGPGWVMSKALEDWDGQTPERHKRIDDYVKSGRFQFHALPFSLESDACEPEEMARGFIFSSNLSRKYGKPLPLSGKMSDVPSHGGALATVLANGGVKFMHIGCNWPSAYVQTPGIFWWEGPDGSRVLTIYSGMYGTATGFNWPDNWTGGTFVGHHFLPPENWPHKIWPAIMVTMDNSGPPSAKAIETALAEVHNKLPGVKVRFGTMDDFATAFLSGKPELPVIKGEMPDTWIHGIMCDPGGSKLSRAVHPQLAATEALHTQLGLWGTAQPAIARDVALAYENILLYGEHTWGAAACIREYGEAFKSTDPKLIENIEGSWEDKTNYIRTANKIADTIAAANLKTLAANVKTAKGSLIVYNPLPWPRSGTVEVNSKRYLAKDVPPCGYLTLKDPVEQADPVLESPFFKVTLDPATGSIASLVDKRSGREWVDATAEHKLGQYLNERFTFEQTLRYTTKYQMDRAQPHPGMHKPGMISEKVTPYRAAVSNKGTILTDSNSATIVCPADPANHLPATALRITLPQDQPYVEMELTIKNKAKDNWPEADWLCLPFKLTNPQFRVHRQLGVMNPATDILPGANRDLFSVGHGVTITDSNGTGIAISPLDHPLVSLDRPGCWQFSKDAAEFTPTRPVVYLNLYNNQWNTNFRYWYPGTWSSRVRISTFDAKTPRAAVIATPAIEARNPLAAVTAAGSGTKLPATQSGLTVSRPGVLVTAFGENPDGKGTLLRVWDQSGESGDLTLTIPGKFTSATPVNLRGEALGTPLQIRNGELKIILRAYAPATYLLD